MKEFHEVTMDDMLLVTGGRSAALYNDGVAKTSSQSGGTGISATVTNIGNGITGAGVVLSASKN